MGRRTLLTPALVADICTAITANGRPAAAAMKCGVSERRFYEWQARGKNEDVGIYHDFVFELKMAKATAETRNLAIIALAAERYWQAAAWYLERTDPDNYGRRARADENRGTAEKVRSAVIDLVDSLKKD